MPRYLAPLILLTGLSVAACGEPGVEPSDAHAPAASAPPTPVAAAPVPPAPVETTARDFNLTGTEPFWGMKVRADSLVLSRMDHAEISVPAPAPQTTGTATTWRTAAFDVRIRLAQCSDGMSDRRYPYEAEVTVGAEVLKGCAYRP